MAPRTRGKTAAKAAKKGATASSPPDKTVITKTNEETQLTDKPADNAPSSTRRLDFSFLASGGTPKKRGRPSNPPKSESTSVSAKEPAANDAAASKSKKPRATAGRTLAKKPIEVVDLSETDSGESLGEDDTDTSSSEEEPTASDEDFIASDSDEEFCKKKAASATATHDDSDSEGEDSSSDDSDSQGSDASAIIEAVTKKATTNTTPRSRKVASKAKATPTKKATPRSSSSKEQENDLDSSSFEEEVEASSRKLTASKKGSSAVSSSKAKKAESDASSSDDSSSSDDDLEEVAAPPTPHHQNWRSKAAAAASPKETVRDHGFKDPKVLCEQKCVFIGVGRSTFHKLASTIYVPKQDALFTAANRLGTSPVSGAFYFSAFDVTGGLRSFQRIRAPNDIPMPSFDPAWLVNERPMSEITCGITFAGLVIGLGEIVERPTRFGGMAVMREVTAVVRDKNNPKTFHTILVTMWGDHTSNPAYVLGDVILVINARQSTFQGVLRFSVGETSAVVLASSLDTAREFTKKAKKFQRKHTGDYLILPDGYILWNENDE